MASCGWNDLLLAATCNFQPASFITLQKIVAIVEMIFDFTSFLPPSLPAKARHRSNLAGSFSSALSKVCKRRGQSSCTRKRCSKYWTHRSTPSPSSLGKKKPDNQATAIYRHRFKWFARHFVPFRSNACTVKQTEFPVPGGTKGHHDWCDETVRRGQRVSFSVSVSVCRISTLLLHGFSKCTIGPEQGNVSADGRSLYFVCKGVTTDNEQGQRGWHRLCFARAISFRKHRIWAK